MARQRTRGQKALVWKQVATLDNRGNSLYAPETGPGTEVRAAFSPVRSSRAELDGQQQINVYRMILDPDLPDVGLWARVQWNGLQWDVVTPPQYHEGSRHVRHITIEIRQRPDAAVT